MQNKTKQIFAGIIASLILGSAGQGVSTADLTLSPISSQSLSLGGSYGLIYGAQSIFVNPVNIGKLNKFGFFASSNNVLFDTNRNSISYVLKNPWGDIGVGFTSLSSGGSIPTMRDTTNASRIVINPSAEAMGFDSSALILAYSNTLPLVQGVSYGIGLKSLKSSISGTIDAASKASGLNIDLGVSYSPTNLSWVNSHFLLRNLPLSELSWSGASNAKDQTGSETVFGADAKIFGLKSLNETIGIGNLFAAIDYIIPANQLSASNSSYLSAGLEWRPVEAFALRAGSGKIAGENCTTFGIGIKREGFGFDYAYKSGSFQDTTSHMFSISYSPEPDKPKPPKVIAPYAMIMTAPSRTVQTEDDSYSIKASVANALKIDSVKIDGRYNAFFTEKDGFEIPYPELKKGPNTIKVEAYPSSPIPGLVTGEARILKISRIADVSPEYFAKESIYYLQELGLMGGYPDGNFRPLSPINRAELVKLLIASRGISLEDTGAVSIFKDMTPKHWAYKYAGTAAKYEIVGGYPDMTFRPNKNVSRAELAAILARYLRLTLGRTNAAPYFDVPTGAILKSDFAGTLESLVEEVSVDKSDFKKLMPAYAVDMLWGELTSNGYIDIRFMNTKTMTTEKFKSLTGEAGLELSSSFTQIRPKIFEILEYNKGIWSDLMNSGYIDGNGFIQQRFKDLKTPTQMKFNKAFIDYRNAVFALLKKKQVSHWSSDFVSATKKEGLFDYIPGITFEPQGNATRGETAYILSKLYFVKSQIEGLFQDRSNKTSEPDTHQVFDMDNKLGGVKTTFINLVLSGGIKTGNLSRITFNGKNIELKARQTLFSLTTPLVAGVNTFTLEAFDRSSKPADRLEVTVYSSAIPKPIIPVREYRY